MKRSLLKIAGVLLISICVLVFFTACPNESKEIERDNFVKPALQNNNSDNQSNAVDSVIDNEEASNTSNTREKIDAEIIRSSCFSEGVALVQYKNKPGVYCINKNGEVVFFVDGDYDVVEDPMYIGYNRPCFVNGVAMLRTKHGSFVLCDKTGNIITPKDLGVTEILYDADFFVEAFKDGYILAKKQTATYNSVKNELGILNSDLKWLVEPNEETYNNYFSKQRRVYRNGYVVNEVGEALNLNDGSVTDVSNVNVVYESDLWYSYYDMKFRNYQNKEMINLYYEKEFCYSGSQVPKFYNGKVVVPMYNREAGVVFFTVADELGDFLFEPINLSGVCGGKYYSAVTFKADDEHIVLVFGDEEYIQVYDYSGNLISEFEPEIPFDSNAGAGFYDGIIVLCYRNAGWCDFRYYTVEGKRLF